MFFIMGINMGRKDLDYGQSMICPHCGQYGRYSVYMTYTLLSLFFIPILKWNRRYYAVSSCCHTSWELDREIGKRIARGEQVEITPADLSMTSTGGGTGSTDGWKYARGNFVNYESNEGYKENQGYKEPDLGDDHDQAWYISNENTGSRYEERQLKRCSHCGFSTEEDYTYCPKCGNKL